MITPRNTKRVEDRMIPSQRRQWMDGLSATCVAQPEDELPGLARPVDRAGIEAGVRQMLIAVGEDPDREGLRETPARVARAYAEIFAGLRQDPADHLRRVFQVDHHDLILVRDIAFHSTCEHHLLPFMGKAHIAYLPRDGQVASGRTFQTCTDR